MILALVFMGESTLIFQTQILSYKLPILQTLLTYKFAKLVKKIRGVFRTQLMEIFVKRINNYKLFILFGKSSVKDLELFHDGCPCHKGFYKIRISTMKELTGS